ncbi:MAG: right-handed parallel beta-helix repeat-containing protein [Verrucomicrobiia bacterium]
MRWKIWSWMFLLAWVCCASSAAPVTFHVAPNGSDANPGTKAKPFATLVRARDAIRELKARPGGLTTPVTVQIKGGTYYVAETVAFTPQDSGTKECPISYVACRGEKPVLCGGRKIAGFKPTGDGKQSVVLPEVKSGAWFFRSLFVNGERQIRARHPNLDPSDPYRKGFLYVDKSPGGFGMAVGNIHNVGDWMEYQVKVPADGDYRFWVCYATDMQRYGVKDMSGRTTLTVDGGQPIPLMNFPNTGGWGIYKWSMAAAVPMKAGEHLLRWQNVKGGGWGLDAYALTNDRDWIPRMDNLPKVADGRHLVVIQAEGFARYNGKQLSVSGTGGSKTAFYFKPGAFKPSWASAPGAEIHIFQSGSCRAFKEIVSIEKVDQANCLVTVGGKECVAPLGTGDRYFVENVLEELDSPCEWHLDRQTGALHCQPKRGFSKGSEVIAPVVGRLVQFMGDAAGGKPVSHIEIAGLTFRCTDYSPEDGCVGYGMGNNGVVYMTNATHCAVSDCAFRNIGKYAVCIAGGGDNAIIGNRIADSAEGGIALLKSARNTVSNNHIQHCGAVYKHIGGVVIEGAGADDNVVSHNLIHDMSRYGISLKNPGRRNIIEFNRVHRTNTETYDTGGIEVTQQDREFRSGGIIRYNVVGDTIGYSCNGAKPVFMSWSIYLDSFAGGYDVNNNICYRNNNGGIMLQGGKDNRVTNNIFVDGATCQGFISNFAGNSTGQVMEQNIFYYTDTNATLFATGKLNAAAIRVDGNLFFCAGGQPPRVGWGGRQPFSDWQKQGFDTHSLVADPRFVNPKRDNYSLRSDSPALKLGFKPISAEKIGLYRSADRASWPVKHTVRPMPEPLAK